MARVAAGLVDVDALLHVAAYGLAGTLAVVVSFSALVTAYDRGSSARRPGPWRAVMLIAGGFCLAVVALGVWAMTQKP